MNEDNKPGDTADSNSSGVSDGEAMLLELARRNYSTSTNYLNGEIREQWERDIAHFQSRHAPGSKFHSPAYKGRSAVFRPKTRLASRANEASLAAAMFSTMDLMDVRAQNENDPQQAAGAAVRKALLQYRLETTIPWFLTTIGAYQDAWIYGICCTYQCWKFEEKIEDVPLTDADGRPMQDPQTGSPIVAQRRKTVLDTPWIENVPPENIRFDPGCDWRDPVGTSPYLIRLTPMYLDDVKAKIAKGEWLPVTDAALRGAAANSDKNTIKRAREQDRPQQEVQLSNNPLVWCHENYVKIDGVEYVFWTAGTNHLLSNPVPLKEAYIIDQRPVVIGRIVIETHRAYPQSQAGLGAGLQTATNEVANQRFDNVALVLNKRYAIRRGKQVDFEALMRNVPGGGIVMDDPTGDLRVIETPDVTASSYNEQDRFDNQIDEMHGVFSASAVNSNRAVGETVGGMSLASGSASQIGEYSIRVFAETWAEPALRQIAAFQSFYETDDTLLAIAGQKAAEQMQRAGVDKITDELLQVSASIRLNVGIGATNPQQKVDRVMQGVEACSRIDGVSSRINADEVIKEVFGALGYRDGDRFIGPTPDAPQGPPPDPMIEVRMQELQLKQQQLQSNQQLQMQKLEFERQKFAAELDLKRELGLAELASRENLTVQQLAAKVGIETMRNQTSRQVKALDANMAQNEMDLKRGMGSGI